MKVLITGASGSFGSAFIRHLVQEGHEKIVAYSRNEAAQARLRESIFPSNVTWMLGDVRDTERLYDSMHRIDTIVHAAALKRVDDNDPMELYATNIQGTINVVRAAIKRNVPPTGRASWQPSSTRCTPTSGANPRRAFPVVGGGTC
jgi:UDP-N-acetylglucosamine 4,6-dehydratase